jgi:diacylglycerol kinase
LADGLRLAWRVDPLFRIVAAVALVVTGTGMVVGLSAIDIAVLALAATIVVVATVIRAALAAAADVDAPGSRALSAATRLASGAVLAAMAGAAVVTAVTFGARLLGALR